LKFFDIAKRGSAPNVDATIRQNVDEEAKWLIDVAVTFLRLSHDAGRFPHIGKVEPHPARASLQGGMKIQGPQMFSEGVFAALYEIDPDVQASANGQKFASNAELIFNPPKRSLAERVSQGLGWLTRGQSG
jgi:hypothetical protein